MPVEQPSPYAGQPENPRDGLPRQTGRAAHLPPDRAADSETPTNRWRFALLVLLFWTVPGLITTTVGLTLSRDSKEQLPALLPIFVSQLTVWWYWAAVTPVVWWLGRSFPLEKRRLPRSLPLHVLCSIVAALLFTFTSVMIVRLAFPASAGSESLVRWFQNYLTSRLPVGVLLYFALLGIGAALDSQKRLRQRDLQASQLSAALARAQVQALQAQLQPHFLFNTLHAIGMLVYEDPAAAGRMLTRLGDLLRQTLALTDIPEITLREELSILDDYLGIEHARFGDRLTVEIDVDESLLGAAIPTFIMQPLVENAVRFGVTSRVGPGRIRIVAKRDGSSVRLSVQDDGPDAPQNSGNAGATTSLVNASPGDASFVDASPVEASPVEASQGEAGPSLPRASVVPQHGNGVGLGSTRARLAALYPIPGQASLVLNKLSTGGTNAILWLPWRDLHA